VAKKVKPWPHIPETPEERDARISDVARRARQIFGSMPTDRRCPQCTKKMVVEYAESINESEYGGFVVLCWSCGYETRL
jgi:uncharacterized protein with PIN domain